MKKFIYVVLILLIITSCNLPSNSPAFTAPTQMVSIVSPQDGAILPFAPINFTVRIFSLRGRVVSLEIKQTYAGGVVGGDATYGPFPVSPATDQIVTAPNITLEPDGDQWAGLLTFVAVANFQDGSKIESPPVTVCITYLNREKASQFYNYEGYSGAGALCIPTILPDSGDDNTRIAVQGVITLNGDRCFPFESDRIGGGSGGGLLLGLYAQTYRTDLIRPVGGVTAEISYTGDYSSDYYSDGEIPLDLQYPTNIWTAFKGISILGSDPADVMYYPLGDNFKQVQVLFRAYDRANIVQATYTATLSLPPCVSGAGQKPEETFTPTLTPTQTPTKKPFIPTETLKPKNEEEQEQPAPEKTECPPTIYCGP